MARAGVHRTSSGLRIVLPEQERQVLAQLPALLREVVEGARPELRARLFPQASEDPEIEKEFRELVGDALATERLEAVDRFAATLEQGERRRSMWIVDLDEDAAQAWLSTVNDVRLVLAPLAGVVSEDAWDRGPDRSSPQSVLLWHLSWLQEELLEALTHGLPDSDGV